MDRVRTGQIPDTTAFAEKLSCSYYPRVEGNLLQTFASARIRRWLAGAEVLSAGAWRIGLDVREAGKEE